MRLIASFTIRACSPSPTWWTVGPIARMSGSTSSNVSRGPETMKLSVPARTTLGLPLTGARRYSTDAAFAREATRAEAEGETVLMSMSTVPGRAGPMTLSATASNASSSASDVRTTATCSTSSSGVLATTAPLAPSASAFSRVRLVTTSG